MVTDCQYNASEPLAVSLVHQKDDERYLSQLEHSLKGFLILHQVFFYICVQREVGQALDGPTA